MTAPAGGFQTRTARTAAHHEVMDAVTELSPAARDLRALRILLLVGLGAATVLGAQRLVLAGAVVDLSGLTSTVTAQVWYAGAATTVAAGALLCGLVVRPGRWAIRPAILLALVALTNVVAGVLQGG
jgi:hypothetical protein